MNILVTLIYKLFVCLSSQVKNAGNNTGSRKLNKNMAFDSK